MDVVQLLSFDGYTFLMKSSALLLGSMNGLMDAHSSRTAEPSLQLSVDDVCTLIMKQTAS
jgi:hypothetical protein